MLRIALVNMPFFAAGFPSLALTQLRSALQREHGPRVEVKTFYLNHDFAERLGFDVAEGIATGIGPIGCHFGDWLFRQAAFPQLPNNDEEYLDLYIDALGGEAQRERLERLLDTRRHYPDFLDEMIDHYRLDDFDVVGFTLLSMQTTASLAMARRLKARRPTLQTLFGGPCCDSPMGQVLVRNVPAVDFVFAGAAIKTLPRFAGCLLDGEAEACHDIHGVISREKLQRCGEACRLETGRDGDINDLLPLDYSEYHASLDRRGGPFASSVALIETSRGCRWAQISQCTFCGYNSTRSQYHEMQPALVRQQLEALAASDRKPLDLYLVDAALPNGYISTVFPDLSLPSHVTMSFFVRPVLNARHLRVLARAGVTAIGSGIEAMSTTTLQLMRKCTTAFQNLAFLKACAKIRGIRYGWDIIIGVAGEPESVYEKYLTDLPLMVHLPAPRRILDTQYYRYSPYFNQQDAFGLRLTPRPSYRLIYPFPPSELDDLAYFFDDAAMTFQRKERLRQWTARLTELLGVWHVRGRDRQLLPQLTVRRRDVEPYLYDSRSGRAVEHPLTPLALNLLEKLEKPQTLEELVAACPAADDSEVRGAVTWLDDRGALFEEDGRYMSLVILPDAETLARTQDPAAADAVDDPVDHQRLAAVG